MATEWLPEGFENRDASAPGRMAQRVRTRVAVHQRRARMVRRASLSALSVVALLGLAHLLPRLLPGKKAPSAQPPVQAARLQTPPGWTPEAVGAAHRGRPESTTVESAVGAAHRGRPDFAGGRAEAPSPTTSLPVTLGKDGQNVELAWKGNPGEEYVIYRCTSPRFDQCGVAGVVKGTKWTDTGKEQAPVVFYKVEPKA